MHVHVVVELSLYSFVGDERFPGCATVLDTCPPPPWGAHFFVLYPLFELQTTRGTQHTTPIGTARFQKYTRYESSFHTTLSAHKVVRRAVQTVPPSSYLTPPTCLYPTSPINHSLPLLIPCASTPLFMHLCVPATRIADVEVARLT